MKLRAAWAENRAAHDAERRQRCHGPRHLLAGLERAGTVTRRCRPAAQPECRCGLDRGGAAVAENEAGEIRAMISEEGSPDPCAPAVGTQQLAVNRDGNAVLLECHPDVAKAGLQHHADHGGR
jgi:hypothetical protein